jgi:hypothetical protein
LLNALLNKGFIMLRGFTAAEDKRPCAYILAREGLTEKAQSTHDFPTLMVEEYKALLVEIDAVLVRRGDA